MQVDNKTWRLHGNHSCTVIVSSVFGGSLQDRFEENRHFFPLYTPSFQPLEWVVKISARTNRTLTYWTRLTFTIKIYNYSTVQLLRVLHVRVVSLYRVLVHSTIVSPVTLHSPRAGMLSFPLYTTVDYAQARRELCGSQEGFTLFPKIYTTFKFCTST